MPAPAENPSTLPGLLFASAERVPDRPLLLEGEGVRTYAEVAAAVRAHAQLLAECGLERGARAALLAPNGSLYVEAYYGILAAGGVAVPLSGGADGDLVASSLRDCGATHLVLHPRFARRVTPVLERCPDLRVVLAPGAERLAATLPSSVRAVDVGAARACAAAASPLAGELDASDRATIIYTSGSTGSPKGVTLTHGNVCANVAAIVEYLALTEEDRVLQVLPFHYVYGKSLLNTHVAVGGSVVIENRSMYPRLVVESLRERQCTGFSGVPSTYAILLEHSDLASAELPHLRYVTQAGGPMSPDLTRRVLAALPGARLFVMYGATEASARLSYVPPERLPEKIGTIGIPIPGVELEVIREDGTVAEVGEVGEIVARGPNIMEGYWNDPEETARVLDERGYHTGDLGFRDADGFYTVAGRKRDMIKSGAHRVAALEVEHAIAEHEDVLQAAVVGVPHETLGEAIHAFVVWRPQVADSACLDDLERFLHRRLPGYKCPARLDVLAELPLGEAGKVQKGELRQRALAAAGAAGEAS